MNKHYDECVDQGTTRNMQASGTETKLYCSVCQLATAFEVLGWKQIKEEKILRHCVSSHGGQSLRVSLSLLGLWVEMFPILHKKSVFIHNFFLRDITEADRSQGCNHILTFKGK